MVELAIQEDLMAQGTARSRTVLAGRLLGLILYGIAFFLPACSVGGSGGDAPDILKGYTCAWVTLMNTFSAEAWHSSYFLAVLSGWINPLLVLYLIFLLFPIFRWPRRVAAVLIALFVAGTWVFFKMLSIAPLTGHILWVVGILLILAGEIFGQKKADATA
jgi:hypothetical protein